MDSGVLENSKIIKIELTQTVKKGGCAAKLPAGELRKFLSGLELKKSSELEVGTETLDDACLWNLGDERLLIQTLDFFTPIVDDPYEFGMIAAANALSDVYAMGGKPWTAMSILAFPASTLPLGLLRPLMEGALSKIHESGACLAGGHTIDDETLKLGFSVTGIVEKSRAWKNSGARTGDVLILTKGLGTGTITTALKNRDAKPEWIDSAIKSMCTLNRVPELLEDLAPDTISAATDITGFGLAGHASQLAQASGVKLDIALTRVPALVGALESIGDENLNRAHRTNEEYCRNRVSFLESVPSSLRWLSFDPQTSGGLLLSVNPKAEEEVLSRLTPKFPATRTIGTVTTLCRQDPWVIFS